MPEPRRVRTRLPAGCVAVTAVCALLAVGSSVPAYGVERPEHQMPFACGTRWEGSTRPDHSPTPLSIDWNRDAHDLGQPVFASAPGTVASVRLDSDGYGNYVVVDHGGRYSSYYAHLSATLVVAGQRVDQGQLVGLLGSTGRSSGPHLHYEQRLDGASQRAHFDGARFRYGTWLTSVNCVDVPVVGDWNGDRLSDVGTFGRRSGSGVFRQRLPGGSVRATSYGASTHTPLVGDWDGDGDSDRGGYNPMTRTFALLGADGSRTTFRFGVLGDLPMAGDWDGDGRFEVGVFRPATHTFYLRSHIGTYSTRVLGRVASLPVAGDWDGDGRFEVGVYDVASGVFTLLRPTGTTKRIRLGGPTSLPVVGHWGYDATSDLGVWDTTTGIFTKRLSAKRTEAIRFGRIR